MKVAKFTIDPADQAAVDAAFAQVAPQSVACCNWPEEFPYAPDVQFRMFHTGERLLLRFDVAEQYTAALVTEDNGAVWTDSCVEFFFAPDGDPEGYYNFETTSIGRMLFAHRISRNVAVVKAVPEVLAKIERRPTIGTEPFAERVGENRWSMTLQIPAEALFCHQWQSWEGVKGRMNLYKCGDNLSHPHFLSWQPITTEHPDFHRPEFFAEVEFSAE